MFGSQTALAAESWWNAEWQSRAKITISASAAGVTGALSDVPVLVRLHTGNFSFLDAKPDGSDLRFVADDDKTPLKFHIEKWEAQNDLGLVWVRVPLIGGGKTQTTLWAYYGNAKAEAASDSKSTWDAPQSVHIQFKDGEMPPKDSTANANNAVQFGGALGKQSFTADGAIFNGTGSLQIAASPSLAFTSASGVTYSVWLKIAGSQQNAILFGQKEGQQPLAVGLNGLRLFTTLGKDTVTSATDLGVSGWHHVAVTAKEKVVLYVDGQEVASGAVVPFDLKGAMTVGTSFAGELDELAVANTARSPDWIKFVAKSQSGGDAVINVGQAESGQAGGSTSYFTILLGAVTLDGWVVIAILMVMMVISFSVMIGKAIFIVKLEKANQLFMGRFRKLTKDLTVLYQPLPASTGKGRRPKNAEGEYANSSLYRIYHGTIDELNNRLDAYKARGDALVLSNQSIGAIRATMDAGMVRESQRLNNQMVLLTIAISGGPFLGLLGTVVGVMITFAAIAAAGDVNVNSIAPGIAAALVATVAGLGVAIPALFGYNYLASKIKNASTDMQVFVDELITKLAENYSV
jgi:biopolymer transport protein ExbB